jgi:hypothetical protein
MFNVELTSSYSKCCVNGRLNTHKNIIDDLKSGVVPGKSPAAEYIQYASSVEEVAFRQTAKMEHICHLS